MSHSTFAADIDQFSTKLEAGAERLTRAIERKESDDSLTGMTKELREILESGSDLLGTVDFERLPDAIDAGELPNLVDAEKIPDAIEHHDPGLALDLRRVRAAIDSERLVDSIDVVEFWRAKRRLDKEVEDVVGPRESTAPAGDSEAAADADRFVSEIKRDAVSEAVYQQAEKKAEAVQEAIIERRAALQESIAANRRRFAGDRPRARSPTAVSSAASSTVPSRVRHSKAETPPRVYGRRWETRRRE